MNSDEPWPQFLLCDYFNASGKRVERLYIALEPGDGADRLRDHFKRRGAERLLDAMAAEARNANEASNLEDAAFALHALLRELEDKRVSVAEVKQIETIGINFCHPVAIPLLLPALEVNFGAKAVSWVRGIFRHLDIGSPFVH